MKKAISLFLALLLALTMFITPTAAAYAQEKSANVSNYAYDVDTGDHVVDQMHTAANLVLEIFDLLHQFVELLCRLLDIDCPLCDGEPVEEEPAETYYTVTFDSNGGSAVDAQVVSANQLPVEPEDPEKEGYTFLGWQTSDGEYYHFDVIDGSDFTLTANWTETVEISEEDREMLKNRDVSGQSTAQMQYSDSAITNVDVDYTLDGNGVVSIQEITSDPMLLTAGLIGNPVEINNAGGAVKEATISFAYDINKLGDTDPEELAIVWYDEANDIVVLLEDSVVDQQAQTVSVKTTHFSKYGVVVRQIWDAAWNTVLPAIRTEEVPYYNIVLAVDRSGSMRGSKMTKSIEAAQNFIDVLADDDQLTLLSFASSTTILVDRATVGDVAEDGTTNRQMIKNKLSSIRASGGTSFQNVLQLASNYEGEDTKYQSLVILLSDGQSSISDSILQTLKANGQKVIAVGIGSDVDKNLMQRIANATAGSYLYCSDASDLADAFIDLQNIYIGSTKDTDGDGLPDLVETVGMRDQYGEIWKTDPNNADTDGDGISDGEEMGTYNALAEKTYFSRVSRPDMYTVHSDEAYLAMPVSMMYCTQSDNTLTFTVYVVDAHYRMVPDILTPMEEDGIPKEYIYSDPVNLSVDLVSIPAPFSLVSKETVVEQKHGFSTTYKTTVELSYSSTSEWKDIVWRVTADNCSEWSGYAENGIMVNYIEKTQTPEPTPQATVNNPASLEYYKERRAHIAYDIFEKLYDITSDKNKNQNRVQQEKLNKIKAALKVVPTSYNIGGDESDLTLPDEVYAVIAEEIYNALDQSDIEKYETDPIKLTNQIYNSIRDGINNVERTITVRNITYTLSGNIFAQSVGVAGITVKWAHHSVLVTYATDAESAAQAIAEYCTALAQLNSDVWKAFVSAYLSDFFNLLNIDVGKNVDHVLDSAEKIIKAMYNKDSANSLLETMAGSALEELKSGGLFSSNKFRKYIIDNIPNGDKIVEAADEYEKMIDKYKDLEEIYRKYQEGKKDLSDVEKQVREFESLYTSISNILYHI